MKTSWTPRALSHLRAAYEYIAEDSSAAAEALLERIFSGVEMLARYPQLGHDGRIDGTRELILAGTPFVIVYQVGPEQIDVLAVFHSARRWPEKL